MSYLSEESTGTARDYTSKADKTSYDKGFDEGMFLNPEFWRQHALNDLIPYWYKSAIDKEYGGFHSNLSRQWEPLPPYDKYPAMISRQIFGFSTGCIYILFFTK